MNLQYLMKLISLSLFMVPAFAMQPQESHNKQTRTYNDLVTARSILEEAQKNAPETPQKRHKTQIENTLDSVNDARDELDVVSPARKKIKKTYEWNEKTDPNVRAFPTILYVLDKNSIKKSATISEESKKQMTENTEKLIEFYKKEPHKKALRDSAIYKSSNDDEDENNNDTNDN
jgi:hypothetical protein